MLSWRRLVLLLLLVRLFQTTDRLELKLRNEKCTATVMFCPLDLVRSDFAHTAAGCVAYTGIRLMYDLRCQAVMLRCVLLWKNCTPW